MTMIDEVANQLSLRRGITRHSVIMRGKHVINCHFLATANLACLNTS